MTQVTRHGQRQGDKDGDVTQQNGDSVEREGGGGLCILQQQMGTAIKASHIKVSQAPSLRFDNKRSTQQSYKQAEAGTSALKTYNLEI